jgi:hemoglobin/transferrin/lactoferrin receptor protein
MKKRLLIFFLIISVGRLNAQQTDTLSGSLQELIITAQRNQQQPLLIPFSTGSISKEKLCAYSPRTTPEALMMINGIFLQKTNHGGGSPFVRGLTGNQVLMLIDGVRLNNSTFRYGPNQYMNTIDVFTIDKIEVAKGTGSVQYGTDAMGGVIQMFSKEPQFITGKKRWSGNAFAKWMSAGMEKTIRSETNYSSDKTAFTAGITYRNFGDIIGGDTTGRQLPSGYKELAWDAKMKFLLHKNAELIIAHQSVQQYHVPVYHKVVLEDFAINEMHPQQRMLNYAKLKIIADKKLFRSAEFIISHQHTEEGRNSRKNGSSTLRRETDKVNTVGFTADIVSFLSKSWSANSGIELYYDKVSSERKDITNGAAVNKRGLYPDNSKYGNYSLYSLHHILLNKIRLDAGIRYNLFDIRITDTSAGNAKLTPSSFVYNAAVLYSFGKQSVYASLSSGYRAPNIDDMGTLGIVDFRYEIPVFSLSPEKSVNYELGYKLQSKKISAAASFYYLKLNNLITRVKLEGQVISGYPVYIKENTEQAYIKGAEAEITTRPGKNFNLYNAATYAYGQNITKHEPMRRIPPFNGRSRVSYEKSKWFAAAEIVYASKQSRLAQGDKDDNRIPAGGTPGWKVFNIYAGYQLDQFKLYAGLQNIFNEDYRTHGSGINGYGRSVIVSLHTKF